MRFRRRITSGAQSLEGADMIYPDSIAVFQHFHLQLIASLSISRTHNQR